MGFKINLGSLGVKLGLDDNDFKSGVASARKQLNSLGKGIAVAAGAGGAMLGAGVAYAVQQYSELEAAVMKAAAVTKEGAANFEAFQNAAFAASSGTQFGAKEAADALGFLSMAGFEAHQSIAALPGVLDLATAASIDLARASDITSDILKAARLDVTDLSHVNDVLVKTFTSSNTNLEMLGETMKYVMPVSASFGQSLETTAALAGVMADAGIKASMSGTAMRQMFLRLAKPMKTTRTAMKDLDISLRDGAGGFVDLIDVIGQLEEAQGRLSTADFNEKVARVFGAEALPGVLVLLDKGSEALGEFRAQLEDSGGTAERVAGLMRETLSAQVKMLRGNIANLAAKLGQMLAPALKAVNELLTKKVVALFNSESAFKSMKESVVTALKTFAALIKVMGGVSAAASVVGGGVGEIVNGLSILAKTVQYVQAAFFVFENEMMGIDPASYRYKKAKENLLQLELQLDKASDSAGTYITDATRMADKLIEGADEMASAVERGADELDSMTHETFNATVQADELAKMLAKIDKGLDDVGGSAKDTSKALKELTADAVGDLTRELETLEKQLERSLEDVAKSREKELEALAKEAKKDLEKVEKKKKKEREKKKKEDERVDKKVWDDWMKSRAQVAAMGEEMLSQFVDITGLISSQFSDHSAMHAVFAGLSAAVDSNKEGMGRLSDGLRGLYSTLLSTIMETDEFKDNMALFKALVREQTGIRGELIPELMNSADGFFGLVETLKGLRTPLEESRSKFDEFGERIFNAAQKAVVTIFSFGRAVEAMRRGILGVVRGIYASMINLIDTINKGLPDRWEISTSGLYDKVDELTEKIASSTAELERYSDAISELDSLTYEEAKAKAQAAAEAERMAENMSELNSELRNAPSGFKRLLARRRFQADGGGMSAMSMQTSMLRPAPTSSTTHVHIYGVTKAEEVVEVLEHKNFLSTGSMTAYQAARFGGSMRSKLTG